MAFTVSDSKKSIPTTLDLGVLRNTLAAYAFGLALIAVIVFAYAIR